MKKLNLFFLIFILSIIVKGQSLDVSVKTCGTNCSITVIKPSIQNFISLLSLNENQFISVMKQYNYFEYNSFGKYRSYTNGSIKNYSNGKCVNTFDFNVMRNEIRFFVSSEMIYPLDVMTSLFRDLRPYYISSKQDSEGYSIDYFAFKLNNFNYEFFITSGKIYDVQVLRSPI